MGMDTDYDVKEAYKHWAMVLVEEAKPLTDVELASCSVTYSAAYRQAMLRRPDHQRRKHASHGPVKPEVGDNVSSMHRVTDVAPDGMMTLENGLATFTPIKCTERTVGVLRSPTVPVQFGSIVFRALPLTEHENGLLSGESMEPWQPIVPGETIASSLAKAFADDGEVTMQRILDDKMQSVCAALDDGKTRLEALRIDDMAAPRCCQARAWQQPIVEEFSNPIGTAELVAEMTGPSRMGGESLSDFCSRVARDIQERIKPLRAAWDGHPPIALDDEIDGVTMRDLIARDEHIRRETPTNYLRKQLTPAQRLAVSAHWSAQLRAKVYRSTQADKERERTRVMVQIDAEDL